MFQREFAMRLVAKPGDNLYCRLSANVQLLAKCGHMIAVSRNSFNPPPKVDSSVVRIEPRNPIPPVNFKEWDGMLRLCFNCKNKTMSAIFRQKPVLKLLQANYMTFCSLHQKPVNTEFASDPQEWIKKQVCAILEETTQFASNRPAKMDNDDFLKLLAAFNSADIHFT